MPRPLGLFLFFYGSSFLSLFFFFGTGGGQAGWALRFASAELRANSEVAIAAAGQDACALQFASGPLQDKGLFLLIQQRIRVYRSYLAFMYATQSAQMQCCWISKLKEHGIYHERCFKRLVSEFSAVPSEEEMDVLLKAQKNILAFQRRAPLTE